MRQVLFTALVACIVGSLAGASVGALAHAPAEPPISTTAVNANTVDGLSAVKATRQKAKRKGKLVATDARGLLPSNIVRAKWALIAGRPAFLADGQVGWNEVQGIPVGFADGVDDGATRITITTSISPLLDIPTGGLGVARDYACPTGKVLGGGAFDPFPADVDVYSSLPLNPTTWRVWATNTGSVGRPIYIWVNCMTTEPGPIIARLSPTARSAVSIAAQGGGARRHDR